jgi:hypothetical protein
LASVTVYLLQIPKEFDPVAQGCESDELPWEKTVMNWNSERVPAQEPSSNSHASLLAPAESSESIPRERCNSFRVAAMGALYPA